MENVFINEKLTVNELALLRRVTPQYIRKQVTEGKITAEEISGVRGFSGKKYLIPVANLPEKDIRRYLRQRKLEEKLREEEEKASEEQEEVLPGNYEALSEKERQELNLKNKILDDWTNYRLEYPGGKAEADQNYVRLLNLQYPEKQLSVRTLYRWKKQRSSTGEQKLVDRRGKHRNHRTLFQKEVVDLFEFYYLDQGRPAASVCRELVRMELQKRGQTELLPYVPSTRTLERWVGIHIPVAVRLYYREGEKACKDKATPFVHRFYEDLESNEIWVCDNHTFDVMVKEGEEERVERVYLTAFLDVRSRKMMGWYVTHAPSADATLYALRRGIENYGIPKRILSDNGREFLTIDLGGRGFRKHSKNAEQDPATIMERLGIDFRTAMVRNARAKIIERSFLTVKEEFSKLFMGYTGGTVLEKPERLKSVVKEKSQLSTLEEFTDYVDLWISGIYNNRNHSGEGMRGMTPNQVFKKYLVEQRKATEDELNLMLLRSTRLQKVKRYGVKLTFYGEDIYFVNEELIMQYLGDEVYVRYDPMHLDQGVRVYDREERFLLVAPQDSKISYFKSKDEVKIKMAEQRHLMNTIKAYKKEKGLQGTSALELYMDQAIRNREDNPEEMDPDVIRILKLPESERTLQQMERVVGAEPIDLSIANQRIRQSRGLE